MKQYKEYSTEDFLEDILFIQWVINPNKESISYWESVIEENPKKEQDIEKAIQFIKSSKFISKKLEPQEKKRMWGEIKEKINLEKKNRKTYFNTLKIAAGILIIFSLSFLFYQSIKRDHEINYSEIKATESGLDNTKVILADESKIELEQTESTIKYDEDGVLELNNEKVVDRENESGEIAMNQIIVPRGKRASISFSDGTKIILNSGSHAIYPVTFSDSKREIYVEGEAYLEVAKDKTKPFIVKTNSMSVRVLGTSFNIKAYVEDDEASVVLVEGSVEIKNKNKKTKLSPNQLYKYNAQTKENKVTSDVNVMEYIGWKDGWLLCNSEELKSVFKKLEIYYDAQILINDPIIETYKTSGKLELKENIEDVLKIISITAPIKYSIDNKTINVYGGKNETN